MTEKLQELEKSINTEKTKTTNNDSVKEGLIKEKTILEFRISELEKSASLSSDFGIDTKVELLTSAIAKLTTLRYTEGKKVLERFASLMLSELHALGLKSFSKVHISENFDITYQQDGDFLSFENIVEGEQLRAKIAMYLSLIQMDIEFNFGRHTRFLIIDSPGKEEADKNYLQGFADIVKGIQDKFGNQLQILIGTAERDLENVVEQQNLTSTNQYVF